MWVGGRAGGGARGGFARGGDFAFYVFEGVAPVGVEVGVAEGPGVFAELTVVGVFHLFFQETRSANRHKIIHRGEDRKGEEKAIICVPKNLFERIYPGKPAK